MTTTKSDPAPVTPRRTAPKPDAPTGPKPVTSTRDLTEYGASRAVGSGSLQPRPRR